MCAPPVGAQLALQPERDVTKVTGVAAAVGGLGSFSCRAADCCGWFGNWWIFRGGLLRTTPLGVTQQLCFRVEEFSAGITRDVGAVGGAVSQIFLGGIANALSEEKNVN